MEANERLKAARLKHFRTAKDAAESLGIPYGTYAGHENGSRGIKRAEFERYARRFKVGLEWLTLGLGSSQETGVRLIGHVGADARPDVVVFTTGQGDLDYDIPVPPEATPSTVALEVRGNSMRTIAKDGWIVYFDQDDIIEGALNLASLYGELCICWLFDGRILFKELHPGKRPGYFFLSSTSDDPLYDMMVEKAAPVTFIRPRGARPKTDVLTSPNGGLER